MSNLLMAIMRVFESLPASHSHLGDCCHGLHWRLNSMVAVQMHTQALGAFIAMVATYDEVQQCSFNYLDVAGKAQHN